MKLIRTDKNHLEKIEYQKNLFPISMYRDAFDEFLNGEFLCHWHEEFEMAIIQEGELSYGFYDSRNQYQSRILKPGDGIFINSKVLHKARQNTPGTKIFSIILPPDLFGLRSASYSYIQYVLPVLEASIPGLFLCGGEEADAELLRSLQGLCDLPRESTCYELQCVERIFQIWRLLFVRLLKEPQLEQTPRAGRMQEERIRLMLSHIHTYYAENLTVEEIAEAAHIGKSECFRCFKRNLGQTPVEYLCNYRLSQAAYLLINSQQSISEVCFACGFGSNSYFGKLFRAKAGMSPGEYRRLHSRDSAK